MNRYIVLGMPSYKNQHFVPRCFFRPFSLNQEGRSINLFNIDRARAIPNAPLKNQCSGDYFYGRDLTLERALQETEGLYASVLKRVVLPDYGLNDHDRLILRRFSFLQHSRTDTAARRIAQIPSAMIDVAYRGAPPESWRTTLREDIIHSLRACVEAMPVVDDLRVCLVRNESSSKFVASDDPAVLTNKFYLQDPRTRGLSSGVSNSGVILFIPMTPTILCILYDGGTYSLPHNAGWITTRDERDVDAINEHQHLNCTANIYFSEWGMHEAVAQAYAAAKSRRPEQRYRVNTAVLASEHKGYKHFSVVPQEELPEEGNILIHVQQVLPAPQRWPSFLRWRSPRRMYTNGSGTGFVRKWALECGRVKGDNYRRVS